MKKVLLLCLALLAATFGFAQQQLATLNHNDSITVYYGASALQQAHAAAVNGDFITLSSGTFSSVDITKLITIRGNGMEEDTIADAAPTIISGDFSITIPADSLHQLRIDGVNMAWTIYCNEVSNAQITRCHIGRIQLAYTTSYFRDMTFINCIIHYVQIANPYIWGATENNQFVNCVILELGGDDLRDNSGNSLVHNCRLINCIAKVANWHLAYDYQNIPAYTCTNCILYYNVNYDAWFNTFNNTTYCHNCIGININGTDDYFFNENHNVHNYHGMEYIFKYFDGTYSTGISFELQDSIATNILGNDNTQIGIYGGMVPFNPRVSPRFVRCNAAPHTTLDGKLSVDLEVVSE